MVEPAALQTLKIVSRVKHVILRNYLSPWAVILSGYHRKLGYLDCFAGEGRFRDETGSLLPGSPIVALRTAVESLAGKSGQSRLLWFVEKGKKQAESLRAALAAEGPLPTTVEVQVLEEDAQDFSERLVADLTGLAKGSQSIPVFVFVDPYGHPISIPTMRQFLALPRVELFVNVMWYQISRDLANPQCEARLDQLFGHQRWRTQLFHAMSGYAREKAFAEYFAAEVGALYSLRFPVRFSPEDDVLGGDKRTKFFLVHFSSHPKAALLMKEVMWSASDVEDDLCFVGRGESSQPRLLSTVPDIEHLKTELKSHFQTREVAFDEIRAQTIDLPFIEKHYRAALRAMEDSGEVTVTRISSKRSGLKQMDRVRFP